MGCDLWWWTLSFVNVPVCGHLPLPVLSLYNAFHEEITVLTFWVRCRSLRGCCSWPFEWWEFLSPCCIPAVQCPGAQPPSLSAHAMAPSSSPWEPENSSPGRHTRDSQLCKRGLGSVRKGAIFLSVSKSCTWKEERTQETETGEEQATKHHSQLCIPALA